jgi:NifU-like protein involved in Fe-S cluster formation
MTESDTASLYTPELLALAISLSQCPYDPDSRYAGNARSRTCGSTLDASFALGEDGLIEQVGLRVSACAIGQAAAAIFAQGAAGMDANAVAAALAEIEAWLDGGPEPRWPGFAPLLPARPHKGRHGALILPWRAALEALPKARSAG